MNLLCSCVQSRRLENQGIFEGIHVIELGTLTFRFSVLDKFRIILLRNAVTKYHNANNGVVMHYLSTYLVLLS